LGWTLSAVTADMLGHLVTEGLEQQRPVRLATQALAG